MSATLTWYNSGPGTKTNTTVAAFYDDLNTLVTSVSGNATYLWQVASVSSGTNPAYLVLKRKDGSAGRILFVTWTSGPAGNNAAILETAPTSNAAYVAWFPVGNVDTPSNLTSSSGTIMGSDTGCTFVAGHFISTIYPANFALSYFDSAESVVLLGQNPASNTGYFLFAGNSLVDGLDVVYAAVGNGETQQFSTSGAFTYAAGGTLAGNTGTTIRSRVPGERQFYAAFTPSGSSSGWASTPVGSTDILTDTAASKAWFVPYPLVSPDVKGGGFGFKLRQMAWGPLSSGAFEVYNVTGPVAAAIQVNAATAGGDGMWLTNFKL